MEKLIYDESNGLWYELQGDYYLPCLALAIEEEHRPIGVCGQRHLRYIKQHKRILKSGVYIELNYQISMPTLRQTQTERKGQKQNEC